MNYFSPILHEVHVIVRVRYSYVSGLHISHKEQTRKTKTFWYAFHWNHIYNESFCSNSTDKSMTMNIQIFSGHSLSWPGFRGKKKSFVVLIKITCLMNWFLSHFAQKFIVDYSAINIHNCTSSGAGIKDKIFSNIFLIEIACLTNLVFSNSAHKFIVNDNPCSIIFKALHHQGQGQGTKLLRFYLKL